MTITYKLHRLSVSNWWIYSVSTFERLTPGLEYKKWQKRSLWSKLSGMMSRCAVYQQSEADCLQRGDNPASRALPPTGDVSKREITHNAHSKLTKSRWRTTYNIWQTFSDPRVVETKFPIEHLTKFSGCLVHVTVRTWLLPKPTVFKCKGICL